MDFYHTKQDMAYKSTRDLNSRQRTFESVVMEGIAPDGGLFVPIMIPKVDLQALESLRGASYEEVAFRIISLYIAPEEMTQDEIKSIIHESYKTFSTPEVTPLRKLSDHTYVLEQFFGPTCAFKDVALQFLGNLFDFFLKRRAQKSPETGPHRLTILGATSGDTGGAAIYGLRGKQNVEVIILHPHNRVSPLQAAQMTSVLDPNVHNVAVEGTFDDCQDLVKECFSDNDLKKSARLGSINSINWARILAQIVYYFYSYLRWVEQSSHSMGDSVSFVVPTGNFGHALAGYYARQMGLPIRKIIVATNANDILHRFFSACDYSAQPVVQTLAPSMDIQKASNFERFLYHLMNDDPYKLLGCIDAMAHGEIKLWQTPEETLAKTKEIFESSRALDEDIKSTIESFLESNHYSLCPHSAAGLFVRNQIVSLDEDAICMATAHPAKFDIQNPFNDPALPQQLVGLTDKPRRCEVVPNDLDQIKAIVNRVVENVQNRTEQHEGNWLSGFVDSLAKLFKS